MDPLIAHQLVDRAIIDRSRNYRNRAIDRIRIAEFAQLIDRAAIDSAQSLGLYFASVVLCTCTLQVRVVSSIFTTVFLHTFLLVELGTVNKLNMNSQVLLIVILDLYL